MSIINTYRALEITYVFLNDYVFFSIDRPPIKSRPTA